MPNAQPHVDPVYGSMPVTLVLRRFNVAGHKSQPLYINDSRLYFLATKNKKPEKAK